MLRKYKALLVGAMIVFMIACEASGPGETDPPGQIVEVCQATLQLHNGQMVCPDSDEDGDHYTNQDELTCGTDPLDINATPDGYVLISSKNNDWQNFVCRYDSTGRSNNRFCQEEYSTTASFDQFIAESHSKTIFHPDYFYDSEPVLVSTGKGNGFPGTDPTAGILLPDCGGGTCVELVDESTPDEPIYYWSDLGLSARYSDQIYAYRNPYTLTFAYGLGLVSVALDSHETICNPKDSDGGEVAISCGSSYSYDSDMNLLSSSVTRLYQDIVRVNEHEFLYADGYESLSAEYVYDDHGHRIAISHRRSTWRQDSLGQWHFSVALSSHEDLVYRGFAACANLPDTDGDGVYDVVDGSPDDPQGREKYDPRACGAPSPTHNPTGFQPSTDGSFVPWISNCSGSAIYQNWLTERQKQIDEGQ